MEWQVVQKCVRDNNQVLGGKLVANRGNEQRVKLFQVRLCGFQKRFFQGLDIVRPQTKLGQLQLQKTELFTYAVNLGQCHNLELFLRDQTHIKTIARRVVLQQERILRQNLLQFFHGNRFGALQAGKFAVHTQYLGKRLHQSVFICAAELP